MKVVHRQMLGPAAPGLLEERETGSVKIDITQGFTSSRSFFGFADSFGELTVEEILFVFLVVDGLAKDTFLAFVLFTHGLRSSFEIFKGAFPGCRCVRDDGTQGWIDPEYATAVRTDDVERITIVIQFLHALIVGVRSEQCQPIN